MSQSNTLLVQDEKPLGPDQIDPYDEALPTDLVILINQQLKTSPWVPPFVKEKIGPHKVIEVPEAYDHIGPGRIIEAYETTGWFRVMYDPQADWPAGIRIFRFYNRFQATDPSSP